MVELSNRPDRPRVRFELPWPWGGEVFELGSLQPLTYITGPLGSGKTRLAVAIAEALPNGRFIGLDRADATMDAGTGTILQQLLADGARESGALRSLLSTWRQPVRPYWCST